MFLLDDRDPAQLVMAMLTADCQLDVLLDLHAPAQHLLDELTDCRSCFGRKEILEVPSALGTLSADHESATREADRSIHVEEHQRIGRILGRRAQDRLLTQQCARETPRSPQEITQQGREHHGTGGQPQCKLAGHFPISRALSLERQLLAQRRLPALVIAEAALGVHHCDSQTAPQHIALLMQLVRAAQRCVRISGASEARMGVSSPAIHRRQSSGRNIDTTVAENSVEPRKRDL